MYTYSCQYCSNKNVFRNTAILNNSHIYCSTCYRENGCGTICIECKFNYMYFNNCDLHDIKCPKCKTSFVPSQLNNIRIRSKNTKDDNVPNKYDSESASDDFISLNLRNIRNTIDNKPKKESKSSNIKHKLDTDNDTDTDTDRLDNNKSKINKSKKETIDYIIKRRKEIADLDTKINDLKNFIKFKQSIK